MSSENLSHPDDSTTSFQLALTSAYADAKKDLGRFNLALFGPTGVGKSTLLNTVFGVPLADVVYKASRTLPAPPEVRAAAEAVAAVRRLAALTAAELTRLTAVTLDAAGHRLDAWVTAVNAILRRGRRSATCLVEVTTDEDLLAMRFGSPVIVVDLDLRYLAKSGDGPVRTRGRLLGTGPDAPIQVELVDTATDRSAVGWPRPRSIA